MRRRTYRPSIRIVKADDVSIRSLDTNAILPKDIAEAATGEAPQASRSICKAGDRTGGICRQPVHHLATRVAGCLDGIEVSRWMLVSQGACAARKVRSGLSLDVVRQVWRRRTWCWRRQSEMGTERWIVIMTVSSRLNSGLSLMRSDSLW